MMKKLVLATLIAGPFGGVPLPVSAAAVVVREAPPAPRAKRVPAARRGYVWSPGHWQWRHKHHVCSRGSWVRERRDNVYNASAWQEHDGRCEMQRGGWKKGDRDGDGVPHRVDKNPNNPARN